MKNKRDSSEKHWGYMFDRLRGILDHERTTATLVTILLIIVSVNTFFEIVAANPHGLFAMFLIALTAMFLAFIYIMDKNDDTKEKAE